MKCAMFGKLPSKRDFVSLGMEQPFLGLWETWLQTGVAVSREEMGPVWRDAFLAAPIWRFWLGASVAGRATAGAVMPSVDKVGRYFPLSVSASAPQGYRLPLPADAALDSWLERIENVLLGLLEDDPGDLQELLAALPVPAAEFTAMLDPPASSGHVLASPGKGVGLLFDALRAEDYDTLHAGRSYWWTLGGDIHPAQLLVNPGMPDPSVFRVMLAPAGSS